MEKIVLEFKDVSVVYPNGFRAVNRVNLAVKKGERFSIIGESGCGKTTLVRAALGLLPKNAKISGSIKINDTEIVGASERTLRNLRGLVAGFVAQEPFSAFNPLLSVLDHIKEAWRVHHLKPETSFIFRSLENLGIENAAQNARKYPFEWSGGMLQRATIAASEAHKPEIIIADEPTSALDASRADSIFQALSMSGATLLIVSHDIQLVRSHSDKIAVMLDGELIETGETKRIFENPRHEYTKTLIASASSGDKNSTIQKESEIVLRAKNLSKTYGNGLSEIRAVKNADLTVRNGEIVGISGASGSGKSTLLRLLATIENPTSGEVFLENEPAASGGAKKILSKKAQRGFVMPIFQNPLSSLNRNWKIWRVVAEPLTAKHLTENFSRKKRREIAREILAEVGLNEEFLDLTPPKLSVGQCQRVAIARALAAKPKVIAADEPTSAHDAQTAHVVMKLFQRITENGTAIVIVSHNEPLLKSNCHRLYRMEDGVLEKE